MRVSEGNEKKEKIKTAVGNKEKGRGFTYSTDVTFPEIIIDRPRKRR